MQFHTLKAENSAGHASSDGWDGTERRQSHERRNYSLNTMRMAVVSPRRFTSRRSSDRRYPVLDRFDSGMAFLAMTILVFSIADAVFTLTLLQHGAREVNPFMNWLLGHSISAFVAVKMLLTTIPVVLLVAAGNIKLFGRFRARSILAALTGMYGGLIVYELGLLSLL